MSKVFKVTYYCNCCQKLFSDSMETETKFEAENVLRKLHPWNCEVRSTTKDVIVLKTEGEKISPKFFRAWNGLPITILKVNEIDRVHHLLLVTVRMRDEQTQHLMWIDPMEIKAVEE